MKRVDILDQRTVTGRFFAATGVTFAALLVIFATAAAVQSHYRRLALDEAPPALAAAMHAAKTPPPHSLVWLRADIAPGDPRLIAVTAGGDVMMGSRDVALNRAIVPGVDAAALIGADLAAVFRRADVAFVNLEGPLYDGEGESPKAGCLRCYAFRSPTHYADVLASMRLSAVNLANNHSGDYGEEGRASTIAELKKRGILVAGLDREGARFAVLPLRDGRQAALIGFAPNEGTLDINDVAAAAERVHALKRLYPVVIVTFHGGGEGWEHAHVGPGHEEFAGEDRGDVIGFAHGVIEAGADLVIGHGPHVPRAVEVYRGRLIAYSLGNFWTYEGISTTESRGLGPVITAFLAPDGSIAGFTLHSTRQTGTGIARLDPDDEAARYVFTLTDADFPATGAQIRKAAAH